MVNIAINLSLGELIILHPITPAALHPNPIHMVRACLPQEQHFLKHLSKLNAILGKYPKSSSKVNIGKNIAIGGNITDITQAKVTYIPSIKTLIIQEGKISPKKKSLIKFLYGRTYLIIILMGNLLGLW